MFEELFATNKNNLLLIDVGNGSIASAIASFEDGQKPKILYGVRKAFDITDAADNYKMAVNMNSLLEDVLKDVIKNGIKKTNSISGALVSMSSPWTITKTKNVSISQDRAFIITKDFIDDVVNKEELIFKKELEDGFVGNQHIERAVILDKAVVSSRLNGYVQEDNIGKKTKIFEASICFSAMHKNVANEVKNIISRTVGIGLEKISIHSFSLVSFFVVRNLFIMDNNFLMMDITGETTELTLVTDDTLIKSTFFPSGRNFIIRQIAKKFNVSSEIAESIFHLYYLEKINDEDKNTVFGVLNDIENEWAVYLENALLELSPNLTLPAKVFLTADDDVVSFYSDCMKLNKTDSTSSFRKNADIIHINKNILSHVYESDPRLKPDEFIGLLAIYFSMKKVFV